MQNDRQITISVGASRKATFWQAQTLLLSELYEKLRIPARGTETMAEYRQHRRDKARHQGFEL